MDRSLKNVVRLIDDYNRLYHTSFKTAPTYRLFPEEDGTYCEFKDKEWPCNGKAGVYLILGKEEEVIYVGQSDSLGRRFYDYFRPYNGNCVVVSPNWSQCPLAIVAIAAPDDKQYERLSLEEYLIGKLNPTDNVRGKSE